MFMTRQQICEINECQLPSSITKITLTIENSNYLSCEIPPLDFSAYPTYMQRIFERLTYFEITSRGINYKIGMGTIDEVVRVINRSCAEVFCYSLLHVIRPYKSLYRWLQNNQYKLMRRDSVIKLFCKATEYFHDKPDSVEKDKQMLTIAKQLYNKYSSELI